MTYTTADLGLVFEAVREALERSRERLNRLDEVNGDHGDHLTAVFEVARQTAMEKNLHDLAETMQTAAERLTLMADNASAQLYGHGLAQFAQGFRRYGITTDEMIRYIQAAVTEKDQVAPSNSTARTGEVLKALANGLAGWKAVEEGRAPGENTLDVGYLFELGMTYLQAKQRGGTRIEILAEAAASASPLSRLPHRYQAGRLAIQSFLAAVRDLPVPGESP